MDRKNERKNPDETTVPRQGAGEDRSTPEEKKSGPQPDGNGATGEPAAFPPHN